MSRYYNRRHQEAPKLKRGDKVYLLRKNIKTRHLNNKLDFKKIGPFKIKEKLRKVNYRLKLLSNIKIVPVFYIALLELVPKNATPIKQIEEIVPKNLDTNKNRD